MKETFSTFKRCRLESVSISRVFRTRHIESCETKHLQSSAYFISKNICLQCDLWMPMYAICCLKTTRFWGFPLSHETNHAQALDTSTWRSIPDVQGHRVTWVIWSFMFASNSGGISKRCFRRLLNQSSKILAEFQTNIGCQNFKNDFDPRHLFFVRSLHSHRRFDGNIQNWHLHLC